MFNEVKTLISYDLMKKMHDGLYDYQCECCDTAIKKLKEPGESFKGQIILPTGSGKTKIAEYLTAEVLNLYFGMEHRYANFAVACHRLILADNLLNRILDTMINEFNYKNFKIVVVNSSEYDEFANDFAKNFENETTKTVLVNFKDISQNIEAYVENENHNGNHVFFVVLYEKDYTADHNKFVRLIKKFEHNCHMDINTLFDYFVKNQTFKKFDIEIPEFNF